MTPLSGSSSELASVVDALKRFTRVEELDATRPPASADLDELAALDPAAQATVALEPALLDEQRLGLAQVGRVEAFGVEAEALLLGELLEELDRDIRGVELGVRRVGTLTEVLAGYEAGTRVGIRGPFGHGVPVEDFAAGYTFVDVKACHGYLLHEFLSARVRPGRSTASCRR